MGQESSRLIILQYHNRHTTSKCRPFQGNVSVISGLTIVRLYVDRLWLRDGEDIVVKIFVVHNTLPVFFNSIEYAIVCNDLNGTVSINCIQASSIVKAGYLVGSRRIQNDIHWGHLKYKPQDQEH